MSKRVDIRKIDKLLPNMLAVDLLDRDRYEYRLGKLRVDRPEEYLQKKLVLVRVLTEFKDAADVNFMKKKRKY